MEPSWKPTASMEALRHRAALLQTIRYFFNERNVLEVDTPLLSPYGVTDCHIDNLTTRPKHQAGDTVYYLQTSPEYAMKRLLAAGSGCIFQLCKAFRDESSGAIHHPEFTLLEWYRIGFTHHDLMDEMDALLQAVLSSATAERITYQALFEQSLQINPHTANRETLLSKLDQHTIRLSNEAIAECNHDDLLQLLMTHCIEPTLGYKAPTFIYDYPASQAALAKLRKDTLPVAERFEVYVKGIELANGFHELTNPFEQKERFQQDQIRRTELGYDNRAIDPNFINALEHGLPDCAGVALGIDRLLMLAMEKHAIKEVIAFL